jgi:hypothetical protein
MASKTMNRLRSTLPGAMAEFPSENERAEYYPGYECLYTPKIDWVNPSD